MKKTFLTLVAFGFGASVAFAQTAEPTDVQQQDATQMEQTPSSVEQTTQGEQTGRTEVQMADVPTAVQDAFKNGQYSDMEVLAIYVESPEDPAAASVFEFELAPKAEGTAASEMEGVETENVSNRQPAVVLLIDENGQIVEEKQADEME